MLIDRDSESMGETVNFISDCVFRAQLAEQAERFSEMSAYMKQVAQGASHVLSEEERNLFSIAYKMLVTKLRSSWKIIRMNEQNQEVLALNSKVAGDDPMVLSCQRKFKLSTQFRQRLEVELTNVCTEVLSLLHDFLIPQVSPSLGKHIPGIVDNLLEMKDRDVASIEFELRCQLELLESTQHTFTRSEDIASLVFYYKMAGDHYRYLAEIKLGDESEFERFSLLALGSYFVASEFARTQLSPIDPIRLSVALNFSAFYQEVMSQPDQATRVAKNAFDEAISELDQAPQAGESELKDVSLVMQMLRDNLTQWTLEDAEEVELASDDSERAKR
eukprot:882327_1